MKIAKRVMQFAVKIFFSLFFAVFGKPRISAKLRQTLELYKGSGFSETFSRARVWDAPFGEVLKYIPDKGIVVDLGCGDGILTNFLALSRPKVKFIGIELNKERVVDADRGLINAKFVHGDILKTNVPQADVITIVHVLHHLPSKKDQEILLTGLKRKLKRGGKIVVVEIIEKPILKYWFTWITDAITVPILFQGKLFASDFYYRTKKEWEVLFEKLNFKVKSHMAHKGKPFSHIVFVCRV